MLCRMSCYLSLPEDMGKKQRTFNVSLGYMINKRPDKWGENQRLRVLFDSGCGATQIDQKFVRHWKKSRDRSTKWSKKQVVSQPIESATLSSPYQHSTPTETSLVRPMWMNHHIRIVTMIE